MHVGIITNPNSRKNKNQPRRPRQLEEAIGPWGEVYQTADVGAINEVIRTFLRKGAKIWVADGGDGAMHWMLRQGLEVLKEGEFKDYKLPMLLPTNGGTFDFIAKTSGIKGSATSILKRLRQLLEKNIQISNVLLDTLSLEGIISTKEGHETPFVTYGFAAAPGGVGQRFFDIFYRQQNRHVGTMVKIIADAIISAPIAYTPLRNIPGMPFVLKEAAREFFSPTKAKVFIDGNELPQNSFTGIHIGAIPINLGGVFRFFTQAKTPGVLHAIVGSPNPAGIIINLPRMYMGSTIRGRDIYDTPCQTMSVESIGEELLNPVIDGECYHGLKRIDFKAGPIVNIPFVPPRLN